MGNTEQIGKSLEFEPGLFQNQFLEDSDSNLLLRIAASKGSVP